MLRLRFRLTGLIGLIRPYPNQKLLDLHEVVCPRLWAYSLWLFARRPEICFVLLLFLFLLQFSPVLVLIVAFHIKYLGGAVLGYRMECSSIAFISIC
jgi:hypothetical protein